MDIDEIGKAQRAKLDAIQASKCRLCGHVCDAGDLVCGLCATPRPGKKPVEHATCQHIFRPFESVCVLCGMSAKPTR